MKYRKLTGVILKKQNYKEADQIATVYTKELGKIRLLAKSLRLSKSKLAGSFQDLTLVEIDITSGRALPTLISSRTLKTYNNLKTDLKKTAIALYGIELVIKLTADEQANPNSFDLLLKFLELVNDCEVNEHSLYILLDAFCIKLLTQLGFSMQHADQTIRVSPQITELINQLEATDLNSCIEINPDKRLVKQLHQHISEFVEYILERHLKSKSFLNSMQNGNSD
ncbi:MAG TPA: DNA repair protein RecO [Verrucomicrobiae bacterium]|nr:DNA repair protein RecO [Verrucomicrobiae bacterium]